MNTDSKLVENAMPMHVSEETLTTETAYFAFLDGSLVLFDKNIPVEGRVAFVSPEYYKLIKLDKNFTQSGDKAYDIAVNGAVGKVDKTAIVVTPTAY